MLEPGVVLTRQLMPDEGVEVVNLIDPKSLLLANRHDRRAGAFSKCGAVAAGRPSLPIETFSTAISTDKSAY
jgi:hypothetical protein